MATVFPAEEWDAEEDAQTLRNAMKGFGTSEEPIINIVVKRNWKQLKEIEDMYKSAFGRDLKDDLKGELKSNFEKVVIGRFLSPEELNATWLRRAMKGIGTRESVLIHVICTKTNAEIEAIKEAFSQLFERDLMKDLAGETSGELEEFLLSLLSAGREEDEEVDEDKANEEAQEIFDAGEGAWGTNESVFNRIFALRSFEQLRATFDAYMILSGKDIALVVTEEMSGHVQEAFLTLINFIRDPISFYAKSLHNAMEGVGTDDWLLQLIILYRCEIDLLEIKEKYKTLYEDVGQGGLDHWIDQDTSGDYEKILRMLCSVSE